MGKRLQCSQGQRQNDRGSSLVLVVAVMAIVGIFAVLLLSLGLMNYRMKYVNLHAQDQFYDAETVLDEIRTGLATAAADAAGIAYQETLEQYGSLDEEARQANYVQRFLEELEQTQLVSPANDAQWNPDYLRSLVSGQTLAGNGLTLDSADGLYTLNRDAAAGQITIKKLRIVYVDANDYMTEIQTDIEICRPSIYYSQATRVPELTSYCMVAQQQTVARGMAASGVRIVGNAYLGNQGASFDNSNITFAPNGESGCVVTAGELCAENGSTVTACAGLAVWVRELYLNSGHWRSMEQGSGKCRLYVSDDVTLVNRFGTSVSAELVGEVYAYGNPSNVRTSGAYIDNAAVPCADGAGFAEDVERNPANYSSAFLINGRNANLDLSRVSRLQIAGNAFIAAKEKHSGNQYDVQTGESVSLKSDQRAYLVPPEYLAADCALGGMNPMPGSAYLGAGGERGLCQEVAERFGVTSDAVRSDPTYLIRDTDGEIVQPLRDAGVIAVRQAYYPVSIGANDLNMVYFFLVFENAGDARAYADSYFGTHADTLKVRIGDDHYNTTVRYPSGVESSEDYDFYYNGSILYADAASGDAGLLSGKCEADGTTPTELGREQNGYQDRFAALCHVLKEDYTELTALEKQRLVYENLVDTEYLEANGSERVFETATGEKAVVTGGNYTVDSTVDADVHVVIAGGSVRVMRDFDGLILAGNDIVFAASGIELRSDSGLVKNALAGTNARYEGMRPADYLRSGEQYLNAQDRRSTEEDAVSGAVDFLDCVTFRNWKKR